MACRLVGAKPFKNQCWSIVNWTRRNKLKWNVNRNSFIFIQENPFENVVWEMAATLSRPQCIKLISICNDVLSYMQATRVEVDSVSIGFERGCYGEKCGNLYHTCVYLPPNNTMVFVGTNNREKSFFDQKLKQILIFVWHLSVHQANRTQSIESIYGDVIKWKHFPRHWTFVRGIHQSHVNPHHKGQWRGALMLFINAPG